VAPASAQGRASARVDPDQAERDEIKFDRAYVAKFGLYGFVKLAWPLLEPSPFVDNWHVEEVCNHLEAVSGVVMPNSTDSRAGRALRRRLVRRLIINIPPGASKSIITCTCGPAYAWIDQPELTWIFTSYSDRLAARDAKRCRDLVQSDWYKKRWPRPIVLDNNNAIFRIGDSEKEGRAVGWRFSTSVRGQITGRHADIQVVDDPIKPMLTQGNAAVTKNEIEFCKTWWDGTMSSRMKDPKTGARVIIMQRLHEEDLAGYALETGEYTHLCLPMRFEPENACVTTVDVDGAVFRLGGDRRANDNELLCEARWGEPEVVRLEADLNVYADAQLQQRPVRAGGQIFKKDWFKFWRPEFFDKGQNPFSGEGFDEIALSADLTFKDTLGSDYVCLQIWGRIEARYFLLDRVYERLNFPNTITAIEALLRKWPNAHKKLVEDKANGPAVISTLERKISGLIAVTPKGGKVARANAVTYLHRAGNVFYPDPTLPGFEWVGLPSKKGGHVANMTGFPLAAHDDTVDAETQMLAEFGENHNALIDTLNQLAKQKQGRA
jgi:predicted phage terminase large subunit-like protein